MQLPAELRDRIESLLSTEDRRKLSAAYSDVSRKYRREDEQRDLQISSDDEAKAYLATRFPATWCAVSDVLSRFVDIDPDFSPLSVLDLGAGPGTATLAARNLWPDITPTLIEPNTYLRNLGKDLLEGEWISQKLQQFPIEKNYDLVIASYVFNEIEADATSVFNSIWDRMNGAFVMIEPGTPQGYRTILAARDHFLKLGANIAAPCPHQQACPLAGSDRWCHFSVRVDRSRLHRQVKPDASLSYEDEKFSYLVITKNPTKKPYFRALGEPHGQKVISLETCQDDGAFEIVRLSKRDSLYKTVKKAGWGDAVHDDGEDE